MSEEERIGAGDSSVTENTTMVELPNGDLVPESTFGKPPADLPHDQLETWFMKRADFLMAQTRK